MNARHIILATHIPPWPIASRHKGDIADGNGLPFFCCPSLGRVLDEEMKKAELLKRDTKLTIFCGHTHAPFDRVLAKNMRIIVGGSDYKKPVMNCLTIKKNVVNLNKENMI